MRSLLWSRRCGFRQMEGRLLLSVLLCDLQSCQSCQIIISCVEQVHLCVIIDRAAANIASAVTCSANNRGRVQAPASVTCELSPFPGPGSSLGRRNVIAVNHVGELLNPRCTSCSPVPQHQAHHRQIPLRTLFPSFSFVPVQSFPAGAKWPETGSRTRAAHSR